MTPPVHSFVAAAGRVPVTRRQAICAGIAGLGTAARDAAAAAPQALTFAQGLQQPWGLAFLPDRRLLVTQKGGALVRDVRQGPDGALYLLTDNAAGRVLRVAP